MSFAALQTLLPEIAERETRTIHVLGADQDLPVGEYVFIEMFCDEDNCDCRWAMIHVYSVRHRGVVATLSYGWEERSHYVRWMRDEEMVDGFVGANEYPLQLQTELTPALLQTFRDMLNQDRAYGERIKHHYHEFRRALAKRATPGTLARPSLPQIRPGRNEPCACGSGRKYKKCCLA